jgi:hypothetical protein
MTGCEAVHVQSHVTAERRRLMACSMTTVRPTDWLWRTLKGTKRERSSAAGHREGRRIVELYERRPSCREVADDPFPGRETWHAILSDGTVHDYVSDSQALKHDPTAALSRRPAVSV